MRAYAVEWVLASVIRANIRVSCKAARVHRHQLARSFPPLRHALETALTTLMMTRRHRRRRDTRLIDAIDKDAARASMLREWCGSSIVLIAGVWWRRCLAVRVRVRNSCAAHRTNTRALPSFPILKGTDAANGRRVLYI